MFRMKVNETKSKTKYNQMNCDDCSLEMQKLCKLYPASYNCKPEVIAYRNEMRINSGETTRDLIFEDGK